MNDNLLQILGSYSACTRRDFLKKSLATAGILSLGDFFLTPAISKSAEEPKLLLPAVDKLAITCLVDFGNDTNLKDMDGVGFSIKRSPFSKTGATNAFSEYGLSLFLESESNGKKHGVLCDFSLTGFALNNNIELLKIDPNRINSLVLSHGHIDHYGGFSDFISKYRDRLPKEISLYVGHANAFARRWNVKEGKREDYGELKRDVVEGNKIKITEVATPYIIGDHVLLSGQIPMLSMHERKSNIAKIEMHGELVEDDFKEELALVYNLRGKGLVIITACGHRGLINTIQHAQDITGIEKIYAVIGGFHLARSSEDDLQIALSILKNLNVEKIIPMHCTGMLGINRLMSSMPANTIYNSTGTRYNLG